jgi:plasmid stabilization system protein ParE
MQSGYKLFWSDRALDDLQNIINYLRKNGLKKKFEILSGDLTKDLN